MRRKLICAILCVSLLLLLVPGITVSAADNGIVRVELSLGKPAAIPFYIDGNYSVAGIPLERQLYTAKLEGGVINLYFGNTVVASGASLMLEQHSSTDGRNNFIWMNINNKAYLGKMEFIASGSGIRAINHVYIEDYLYGVLPYEMSDSWPIEALKAQAVAARGYAQRNIAGVLSDTSADQVYGGFNPAYGNSIQAVNETAKTVLTYNGQIIETFYSASNGGYTDIPQHVWSATNPVMPYHVIQLDPYDVQNPYSRQEVLIFPKAITDTNRISYLRSDGGTMVPGDGSEALKAEEYFKAAALPAVAAQGYIAGGTGDIQIIGINSIAAHTHDTTRSQKHGGVPGVYNGNDYNGTNGCVDFVNANVNMTVLAKRYVTSTGAPFVTLGDCDGDGKINIYDYTFIRLDILGLKPLTGNARIAADVNQDGVINIYDYTLIRLDILGLKKIVQPDPSQGVLVQEPITVDFTIDMHAFDTGGPYAAFQYGDSTLRLLVVEQTETSWNIYHRRYGHGIGLSQRGAQQRANAGIGYAEILGFYFPNTALTQLVYDRPALTPISPPDSTNATVIDTSGPLNVRSGPGTSNAVVGTLPYGARIKVKDTTSYSGWYVIDYGGADAFVSASKVQLG
jgi:peptidoglycan hydrolase-like amidase